MDTSIIKNRWRFSLRSLLVLVTLICLGLFWLTRPLAELRDQRRAIAELENLGAEITVDGGVRREPSIRRTILGYFFRGVTHYLKYRVDLSSTSFTDQDLLLLQKLPYLSRLDLNGTQVTDAGLASVSFCTNLTELNLSNTQVTDVGLNNIAKCLNLRELNLTNTQVTDTGILKLKSLPFLAWLMTTGTAVSYPALVELNDRLPWANFAEQRAIAEVQALGGQAPAVRRILEVENYPPDGVVRIGEKLMSGHLLLGMLHNRRLILDKADISHLAHLECLKRLQIHYASIEPGSFANVPRLPQLKKLLIQLTDITDLDMKHLSRQSQLEEFVLYDSKLVTDKGVSELAKLKNLRTLEVSGCEKVNPESIESLREKLPDCKINE